MTRRRCCVCPPAVAAQQAIASNLVDEMTDNAKKNPAGAAKMAMKAAKK